LGLRSGGTVVVVYGTITLYGDPFAWSLTNAALYHSLSDRQTRPNGPTTPNAQRLPAITRARFSLFRFRSPLLTESRLFSLPAGTEMFHFPAFPPHALCVQAWVTGHVSCRVSPFGNPRIKARLAAPRGFSQPPTSFFGSWCQGIHRVPLLTWPQRCSRPLCSSQITGGPIPLYRKALKWSDRGNGPAAGADGSMCPKEASLPQDSTACLGRTPGRLIVPTSRGCTELSCSSGRPTGQCSTPEHHPVRDWRRHGSGRQARGLPPVAP
jgi:hypothetical protein